MQRNVCKENFGAEVTCQYKVLVVIIAEAAAPEFSEERPPIVLHHSSVRCRGVT
jgi:hypothetical protein